MEKSIKEIEEKIEEIKNIDKGNITLEMLDYFINFFLEKYKELEKYKSE